MNLHGKRFLFFSARAVGIPENIVSALEMSGAHVDYYDERPANTFLVKALIRINRNLIASYINSYHRQIIFNVRHARYDYILFIKGESFSENNLKLLIEQHPESKTIIYHWDSIANNNNAINLIPYFNKVFSFDRYDCKKLGMNFLPLFYYNEYKEVAKFKSGYDYDLMFVGTTHSDRYRFIRSISSQIKMNGGKCFTYFFFQGKIMFYRYKLLNKEMRKIPASEFQFIPMKKNELLELYKKSRIIVDVQHPKQTGLTLRTMEALGAKRKLITTNSDVEFYDFYNPTNILIVDRNNPVINTEFLNSEYSELPDEIYEKYSINSWIEKLLS